MAKIKYNYAIDERERLISISMVDQETHLGRVFKCVSCGGDMVAKFGKEDAKRKTTPHFSHKVCDCSFESYLHSLAKRILKEKFENSEQFMVKMKRSVLCNEASSCPIFVSDSCKGFVLQEFDLKKYYQMVTEEKQFDGFRADVLLEDTSGQHKPIFFEIKYKHACSSEKIASGNMIIEIDVESEKQLGDLLESDLEESDGLRFIGFRRDSAQSSKDVVQERIQHFSLFSSGKASVPEIHECYDCKTSVYTHSIFEIVFNLDYIGFPTPYDYGYVAALDEGIPVKTCQLCKFRKDGYERGNRPHFCCMYKKRMMGNEAEKYAYMYPNGTDAKDCRYYEKDQDFIQKVHEVMKNAPYKRLK